MRVVAAVFWGERPSSRGELEAAKLDLAEARKSQGLGAKVGAFFRRFGATPECGRRNDGATRGRCPHEGECPGEGPARSARSSKQKAGGDVDLDDALYARGEQAKMVAHDVLQRGRRRSEGLVQAIDRPCTRRSSRAADGRARWSWIRRRRRASACRSGLRMHVYDVRKRRW